MIKNDKQIISQPKRHDFTSKHAGAFGTVKNSSKTEISRISTNTIEKISRTSDTATQILQIKYLEQCYEWICKNNDEMCVKDLGISSNL